MVSPKVRRDNIGQSNSTAALFLGGVRRNWMGPVEHRRHETGTNISALAPSDGQASASIQDSATEPGLMSPTTPGETQPLSHGPAVTVKKPNATQATTIPSPAPSTNSHPSPVGADAVASDRILRLPSIETQPTLRNDDRMAIQPPIGAHQGTQDARAGPALVQENISPAITPVTPIQNDYTPDLAISDETWKEWSERFESLVNEWEKNDLMQSSKPGESNIVRPRIALMRMAFSLKDLFYVVMHQVYCHYSMDKLILGQIRAPVAGMQMLTGLLEDNRKMHYSVTSIFAHFPYAQTQLFELAWYQRTVRSVPMFLTQLVRTWREFHLTATHPPLVTDLHNQFALSSPVLMLVLFTCVARRLHPEHYVEQLQALFWKDWRDLMLRNHPGGSNLSNHTVLAHNEGFKRSYLKFPRLPSSSPHTPLEGPSPVGSLHAEGHSSSASPTARDIAQLRISPTGQPLVSSSAQIQATVTVPTSESHQRSGENFERQSFGIPGSSQRFNNQVPHEVRSSQSSQAQTVQRQMHMHMQLQMQAQHLQQVASHPSFPYPVTHSSGVRSGSHPNPVLVNPATSANPYVLQPVPFASSQHSQSLGHIPPTHHTAQNFSQGVPQAFHNHPQPSQPIRYSTVSSHGRPSQPPRGTFTPRPPRPPPQYRPPPQSHPHPQSSPLLPLPGQRAPLTVNGDPMRLGLHLANLRDPMKKLVTAGPGGEPIETELFSYFAKFLISPTLINVDEPSYTWNFNLSPGDTNRLPRITGAKDGHPSLWTYQPDCHTIRLRSICLSGNPDSVDEQTWATSATHWPSVFYIAVNGRELHVRRKVQNLKDLPLDISEHLKPHENSIRIDLLLGHDECKKKRYFFGVEIMEIDSFENVLHLVQPISATDSRAAIQKRLAPISQDDDLAVVTDNLNISLVDPFMARVFDIPARSRHCNHLECFDRDTFIKTRKSVSGPTPMVEEWRCPICKADSRPQFLIVDQFFVEIHTELTRTNRLNEARAIQVKIDGSWTLKATADETSSEPPRDPCSSPTSLKRKADGLGVSSDQAVARTKKETGASRTLSTPSQNHEVIELD